ncbi:aminoacyl-tRNA hydrolase [Desulforhopalus vacuolatus]|uniref:aminoacyl-tRNA hydrolase n=1 Tax=Desulforhopalus vacuolatus TaxID=40414 RepID=UPI001965699F|nr:aminoacyl-tRNA hydrolase [Desulforhopalus vacuolatus]MBM9520685.1 aminoacyl-tRNA hydrolase [Desulforhopalus vacuolatus]
MAMKREVLVVGLGNPGAEYENTRHNAGFNCVDDLSNRFHCGMWKEKWNALYCEATPGGNRLFFVKPLTYMNRSGDAVCRFTSFFKISPENMLVIHDDLDMNPGRIKLVQGGGHGGHNGIKSLVDRIGSRDFFRLKIGIGRPGRGGVHPDFPVEKYVLSLLTDQEHLIFDARKEPIFSGVKQILAGDVARAKNTLNSLK